MSYAIFVAIGDMFFQLIGNGMLMTVFFSLLIVFFLAAAKVTNPTVYISILTPMLLLFVINKTTTNSIEIAPWLAFVLYMILGIFFSIALFKLFTDN